MSNIDSLTNLYSLSKTVRFELKPIEKTLELMKQEFRYDPELGTFMADHDIKNKYQLLKPILDRVHEEFINESLSLPEASEIDFSPYFGCYQDLKANRKNKEVVGKIYSKLNGIENDLRKEIVKLFQIAADAFKKKVSGSSAGRISFREDGVKILTEKKILDYIEAGLGENKGESSRDKIKSAIQFFREFFAYLTTYNENRKNYYTTKKRSTAIPTRIVNVNLPRFCDNIITFNRYRESYLEVFASSEVKDGDHKEGLTLQPINTELFDIGYFPRSMSQSGIDTYNKMVAVANSIINQYNQKNQKKSDFKPLPEYKALHNQIGCAEQKVLFFTITDDSKLQADRKRNEGKTAYSLEEVLADIAEEGRRLFVFEDKSGESKSGDGELNTLGDIVEYIEDCVKNANSYAGIYLSKRALNTISNRYFTSWSDLAELLIKSKVLNPPSKKKATQVPIPDSIELEDLFAALDKSGLDARALFRQRIQEDESYHALFADNTKKPSEILLNILKEDLRSHAKNFLDLIPAIKKISSEGEYFSKKSKENIKKWLDHALAITRMIRYFQVQENEAKGDVADARLDRAIHVFAYRKAGPSWHEWYNVVRDYLTKKKHVKVRENMLRLNFGEPHLLDGWQEVGIKQKAQYHGYILKRDKRFYLGISSYDQFLSCAKYPDITTSGEEKHFLKLEYKNLDWYKNIVGGKVYTAYTKEKLGKEMSFKNHKKQERDGEELVEFVKSLIRDKYLRKYPELERVLKKDYSSCSELEKEFNTLNFPKMEFVPIKEEYVLNQVRTVGNKSHFLYLFEITNKDFGRKAMGVKNLHTLYWEFLFSDYNIKKGIMGLEGGAKIFFRPHVDLLDKKIKDGYEGKDWVIEKKRFTENLQLTSNEPPSNRDGKMFFFHCPIKFNLKPKYPEVTKDISKHILDKWGGNCFLGIDRGERHLAYYCLVDSSGNIIQQNGKPVQGTLNAPFTDQTGKPRLVRTLKRFEDETGNVQEKTLDCADYNELLNARAENRAFARRNWQTIEYIKELKDGYISQIVPVIANLAIKYRAYIVMEDLSDEFKRGRQKIEKAVYQKLELALAKKLNFFVDKKTIIGEIGSPAHALQLTPPVSTYSNTKTKQFGIIWYVRANHTSQTDPTTGWRKKIFLKAGSEKAIIDQIVREFDDIVFDGKDYVFKYTDRLTGKEWSLYSGMDGVSLDRYRYVIDKSKDKFWELKKYDIVKILDIVFKNFDKKKSLLSQLKSREALLNKFEENRTAAESLRFAIDLIQQIRNQGDTERDIDFLQSPVRDGEGKHYDSRTAPLSLPTNGDANGAYNIARKGIIMAELMKLGLDVGISDNEWDCWLAGRSTWEDFIKQFIKKES